jgi:mono/diheme cytochrome c family protein
MKKQLLNYTGFILAILLLASCENDSTNDLILYNVTPETNVTYNQNVEAIINSNCISCHGATPSNGAPMSLTTYEQVKEAVQNRGLLDRISRDQGAPGMMPNGGTRLPQNNINVINQWNMQGLQQ